MAVKEVNIGHLAIFFLAFQLEKKTLNPSAQELKIQWEINSFTFFNVDQNTSTKKIQSRNYISLYEKTDFGFNFRPWEVPKLQNTQ